MCLDLKRRAIRAGPGLWLWSADSEYYPIAVFLYALVYFKGHNRDNSFGAMKGVTAFIS